MKTLTRFILTIVLALTPVLAYESDKGMDKEDGKLESPVTVSIAANQSAQNLRDIKKIFVAQFGSGEGAELIRQKVINRLIKSGIVTVANSANNADATLAGGVEVSSRHFFYMNPASGFCSGGTRRRAEGAVQLIGKNEQTLWTAEKSSRFSIGSVSSTVARRIADSLVAAIEKERAQIAVKPDSLPAN